MINDLNEQLKQTIKNKIKKEEKVKLTNIISSNIFALGWNFVIPLTLFTLLGVFLSKWADIFLIFFIMLGLLLSFLNCFFFLKKTLQK